AYAQRYIGFSQKEDYDIGGSQSPIVRAMLRCLWSSVAQMTVTSLQDLCGLGSEWRMNYPGRAEGMWRVRFSSEMIEAVDYIYLRELNFLYQRNTDYRLVYVPMAETGAREAELAEASALDDSCDPMLEVLRQELALQELATSIPELARP
ncbi:MAG: 4-alpha-glucanotransferase, partial [Eubacteriales bacterium]|nr:4-alpha-glucanotransferase [Eubacteriales bacterium]